MKEYYIKHKQVINGILFLLLGLLCITLLRSILSNVNTYSKIIDILDQKKANVTSLLLASTSASTLITLIPGDVGTPIATNIADLSNIFLGILSILYLEKYLLTIIGTIVSIVFGTASIIVGICILCNTNKLINFSKSISIIGLLMFLIIPTSVSITSAIDKTYSASIENSLNTAIESQEKESETKEANNIWESISNAFSSVAESISSAASSSYKWAAETLSNFIEATAVMLVTSCLIPVITLIIAIWLAKLLIENITKKEVSLRLPTKKEEN